MAIPYTLHNSTGSTKYIIDADELNANFTYCAAGTGLAAGAIHPVHITSDVSDFSFPGGVILGLTNSFPSVPVEGTMFYHSVDRQFYGVSKDGSGNLQFVILG